MSYCRFENTFRDLQDCYQEMDGIEFDQLSETEQRYRTKLIELCKDIADDFCTDEDSE